MIFTTFLNSTKIIPQVKIIQLSLCTHYHNTDQYYLGLMNFKCRYCDILYYSSKKSNNIFNKYCTNSAIILDLIPPPHFLLRKRNTLEAKHFQKEIRSYYNVLTFLPSVVILQIKKWSNKRQQPGWIFNV